MTAEVVSAYVSNNTLATGQLADVIQAVYNSLRGLEGGISEAVAEPLKPAVPIRKSVTPEYLICLEDGKKLKMLKRHLRSTYNLSPDEYRTSGACRRIIRWLRRNMPSSARNSPRRSVSGAAPGAIRVGPRPRMR